MCGANPDLAPMSALAISHQSSTALRTEDPAYGVISQIRPQPCAPP